MLCYKQPPQIFSMFSNMHGAVSDSSTQMHAHACMHLPIHREKITCKEKVEKWSGNEAWITLSLHTMKGYTQNYGKGSLKVCGTVQYRDYYCSRPLALYHANHMHGRILSHGRQFLSRRICGSIVAAAQQETIKVAFLLLEVAAGVVKAATWDSCGCIAHHQLEVSALIRVIWPDKSQNKQHCCVWGWSE